MSPIPHEKAVLKIAVLCCDIPAGRRALNALSRLANQDEPAIHVEPSVWYIDSLHERNMARAVADGVAADHIVVATTVSTLPPVAQQWLSAVLAKRDRPTQVLGWWGGRDEWSTLEIQPFGSRVAGVTTNTMISAAA